jgi:hypothetical protein
MESVSQMLSAEDASLLTDSHPLLFCMGTFQDRTMF